MSDGYDARRKVYEHALSEMHPRQREMLKAMEEQFRNDPEINKFNEELDALLAAAWKRDKRMVNRELMNRRLVVMSIVLSAYTKLLAHQTYCSALLVDAMKEQMPGTHDPHMMLIDVLSEILPNIRRITQAALEDAISVGKENRAKEKA